VTIKCKVARNVSGLSGRNLFLVKSPERRIVRRLLEFGKFVHAWARKYLLLRHWTTKQWHEIFKEEWMGSGLTFSKVRSPMLSLEFFIDIFFPAADSNRIKVKVKWSCYRPGVAQRVGRGIALLFQYRGTRRGWVVSSTPRPHFTPGKDPVPIAQEAGWAPGPVWTGGKSRPHRDSIPDRPARSQSLYQLSDPAHNINEAQELFMGTKAAGA